MTMTTSWGPPRGAGLWRVAANGGEPEPLTKPTPRRARCILPARPPGQQIRVVHDRFRQRLPGSRIDAVDVSTGERKTVFEPAPILQLRFRYLVHATLNRSTDAQTRFRASLRAVRFDPSERDARRLGDRVRGIDDGGHCRGELRLFGAGRCGICPAGYGPDCVAAKHPPVGRPKRSETPIPAAPRAYAQRVSHPTAPASLSIFAIKRTTSRSGISSGNR